MCRRCLYCYRPLAEGEIDMHPACIRKFFGTKQMPAFDYSAAQMDELAAQIIRDRTSLTGVQPKLSLHIMEHEGRRRLTIVGLWGAYICKPQTPMYAALPEVEEIAMEDMCQLTGRLTEDKYRSSCERVGKAVLQYSSMPKMDVTNFLELLMFCWLTGNNDMHLKNFSIYEPAEGVFRLSPAYDLLNAAIVNPKDDEELALTLNGRKKNINMADFLKLAETLGIEAVTVRRLAEKFIRLLPKSEAIIDSSFVPEELKARYKELLRERLARLR